MSDETTPRRSANMEKAEGNRSTAEENIHESEGSSGAGYQDENGDNAGGITNRPPVPADDDVLDRENPRRGETPRRYEEEGHESDPVMPSNDSTLDTRI